jgi:hypothetical protein
MFCGKDGFTVKKLIALMLLAAFICASSIGCGDTKPTGGKATGGAEKKDENK